jgi:hypothetical protein
MCPGVRVILTQYLLIQGKIRYALPWNSTGVETMRFDRNQFRRELRGCGRILKDWLTEDWVLSRIFKVGTKQGVLCVTRFQISELEQTRYHSISDLFFLLAWGIGIVFIFLFESVFTSLKFLFWLFISSILMTIGIISCLKPNKRTRQ